MTDPGVVQAAVREAIQSLGYVTAAAEDTIARLCTENPAMHPRSLATAFRKEGAQISAAEKKILGIRSNSFMSREALDQLTEKGRGAPLDAHFITALRAGFTIMRFGQAEPPKIDLDDGRYWVAKYSGIFGSKCRACNRLDGARVEVDTFSPYPPNDCDIDGCAIRVDWRFRSPLMRYDDEL